MPFGGHKGFLFTLEHVAILGMEETRWLMFRDVPDLVQKYVNGTTALDYGCGCGTSTLFLKSMGLNADGVDISKGLLAHAKITDPAGKYSFIKSGVIPADDQHYDLINSTYVLPYIDNKMELGYVVKEMYRVLKHGGTCMAVVNNENTFRYDWLSVKTDFEENRIVNSGSPVKVNLKRHNINAYYYHWTDDDYRKVFTNAGFQILTVHRSLGNAADGYKWHSEKDIPPFNIYVAKKE